MLVGVTMIFLLNLENFCVFKVIEMKEIGREELLIVKIVNRYIIG